MQWPSREHVERASLNRMQDEAGQELPQPSGADQCAELRELKSLALPESFGLERRVQRYEGKRPIGLYRWDLECLLDTLSLELEDRFPYPRLRR